MNNQPSLNDLEVVIRHKNGRYLASVPQIGLYATAESLPKAADAIEVKRQALNEELSKAGALEDVAAALSASVLAQPAAQRSLAFGFLTFLAKSVTIIGLLVFAVLYTDRVVARRMEQFNQSMKIGGASFWAKVEEQFHKAAAPSNDMPAEKKKQLLVDIHVLVERWRPFVKEAQLLFGEGEAPQQQNK